MVPRGHGSWLSQSCDWSCCGDEWACSNELGQMAGMEGIWEQAGRSRFPFPFLGWTTMSE